MEVLNSRYLKYVAGEEEEQAYVATLKTRAEARFSIFIDSDDFVEAYLLTRKMYDDENGNWIGTEEQLLRTIVHDITSRSTSRGSSATASSIALSNSSEGSTDNDLAEDPEEREEIRQANIQRAISNKLKRSASSDDPDEIITPAILVKALKANISQNAQKQRRQRGIIDDSSSSDNDDDNDATIVLAYTSNPSDSSVIKGIKSQLRAAVINKLQADAYDENDASAPTDMELDRILRRGVRQGAIENDDDAAYVRKELVVMNRSRYVDGVAEDEEEETADIMRTLDQEKKVRSAIVKKGFIEAFIDRRDDSPFVVSVKENMVRDFLQQFPTNKRARILPFIQEGISLQRIRTPDEAVAYALQQEEVRILPRFQSAFYQFISYTESDENDDDDDIDDANNVDGFSSKIRRLPHFSFPETFIYDVNTDTATTVAIKQRFLNTHLRNIARKVRAKDLTPKQLLLLVRDGIDQSLIENEQDAIRFIMMWQPPPEDKPPEIFMSSLREDWIEPKETEERYNVSQLWSRPPPRAIQATRKAAFQAQFDRVVTPDIDIPFRKQLHAPQQQAIVDCTQSHSRLVVAHTGFGKSWVILAVAAYWSAQGQKVMIVIRNATFAKFQEDLLRFHRSNNIMLMTHESFTNIAKSHINFMNGTLAPNPNAKTFNAFQQTFAGIGVIIFDECQYVARHRFDLSAKLIPAEEMQAINDPLLIRRSGSKIALKLPSPLAPYVAMVVSGSLKCRTYLLSATPCSEYVEELKSLLFMVKGLNPPGALDLADRYNDRFISDYSVFANGDVFSVPLNNQQVSITYNWKCLVSYYVLNKTTVDYHENWAQVRKITVNVPMTRIELRRYEQIEANGGWRQFGTGVRHACEANASKTQRMFEIIKYEVFDKFKAFTDRKQLKTRVLVYTKEIEYARRLVQAMSQDVTLRRTKAKYVPADKFKDASYLDDFVRDDGDCHVIFVTRSGITGYDPPPLTSIIAMNAFWTPAEETQLLGRLNRYKKHNFMNKFEVDKLFNAYTIASTKSQAENEAMVENNVLHEDTETIQSKEYSFDTRQIKVLSEKLRFLETGLRELFEASPQNAILTNQCLADVIEEQRQAQIKYI